MSLFDGLEKISNAVGTISQVEDIFQNNDPLSAVIKSVELFENQSNVTASTTPKQAENLPAPTRLNIKTDANTPIPVVYGSAWTTGSVTDAQLNTLNGDCILSVCITLCEKTGTLMSDSTDSLITLKEVYMNNKRMIFGADGVTISGLEDPDTGEINTEVAGLVEIYPFSGGSLEPTFFSFTNDTGNTQPAYHVMPNWTTDHTMDNLVFAICKVKYKPEKGIDTLPDFEFQLSNTMRKPGDCIYDYLTSTRYGAGLSDEEIAS